MATPPRAPGRRTVSRRQFLAAAGGGVLALAACRASDAPAPAPAAPPAQPNPAPAQPTRPAGKALTGDELALCAAACERILPADGDPGANQLGVVDYMDARLAREGKRALQQKQRFRRGLARLAEWSQQRHQKDFLALGGLDQDQTLASLAAEGGEEGYGFVKQLVSLTLEGAFADPAYGGNRGKGGWGLIGFDAPCPNPRCE